MVNGHKNAVFKLIVSLVPNMYLRWNSIQHITKLIFQIMKELFKKLLLHCVRLRHFEQSCSIYSKNRAHIKWRGRSQRDCLVNRHKNDVFELIFSSVPIIYLRCNSIQHVIKLIFLNNERTVPKTIIALFSSAPFGTIV